MITHAVNQITGEDSTPAIQGRGRKRRIGLWMVRAAFLLAAWAVFVGLS